MSTINGLHGVKATVLCDSVSEAGVRLTTFEIEYPRLILSELNTHRMLSKNSASSRAIPFAKMQEQLTGRPIRFGKNVSGMQDSGEHVAYIMGKPVEYDGNTGAGAYTPEEAWEAAREDAIFWSDAYKEAGYHKQVFNRLTEPFQFMKTVISGTEWDNFFWLRDDKAADPSIAELARCMRIAREQSVPNLLKAGQWHLPYVNIVYNEYDEQLFFIDKGSMDVLSLEDAIKVSCARCCAVSYRNTDYTLEKSLAVYNRLVGDERKHASALEHCATPVQELYPQVYFNSGGDVEVKSYIEDGVSHISLEDGSAWSGNYRGWVQHRKTILNENYIKA